MLQEITFNLPNNSPFEKDFFDCLKTVLLELPNSKSSNNTVTLTATCADQAFPKTTFHPDGHSNLPRIMLNSNNNLSELFSKSISSHTNVVSSIEKRDNLGIYYETSINGKKSYEIPIQELQKRLKGHITRIDHTGINLPKNTVTQGEWNKVVKDISTQCTLYNYPTGEPWLFILPATNSEFKTDISEFISGRDPKFELVYDTFSSAPTIQIDIETDLERVEIERLFPEPYAVSWPNLAAYFRTVFIYHEWDNLIIRFDLRYKNSNQDDEWNTGKWLVEDGGRINAPKLIH